MASPERLLAIPAVVGIVMMVVGDGIVDVVGLLLALVPLFVGVVAFLRRR